MLTKNTGVSIGLVFGLIGGGIFVYDRLSNKLDTEVTAIERKIETRVQKEIYIRDREAQRERNNQFERIIDLKLEMIHRDLKKVLEERG